ncbi:hypothetical protein LCGC14_1429510, partial [marine sediment metagenome]
GKDQLLEVLEATNMGSGAIAYIRQHRALGLGHAVWCARRLIGDEPFAVILPDDVIAADTPCLQQMVDAYKETKRDALELHGIEMEKSLIHGIYTVGTGANGKPERTTQGLLSAIRTYATSNVDAYHLNTDYSAQTWLEGGDDWMDEFLEKIFRHGKDEKLAYVGSGAVRAINQLAKFHGNYDISAQTVAWGIKVMQWVTPFGIVYLKRHPLFSYEPTTRNSMVVFEPGNFIWRYVSDTFFKPDNSEREGGSPGKDGTTEAYLTEAGLEYHFMEGSGFLTGLGRDNAV